MAATIVPWRQIGYGQGCLEPVFGSYSVSFSALRSREGKAASQA